ncbi:hypothetical protein MY11210_001155 [Beauveria gryllotalpidicola]
MTLARTREEKADVLAQKFFPAPVADDLGAAPGPEREPPAARPPWDATEILAPITAEEVKDTLRACTAWNAPGPDGVPYGLLKALGPPLYEVLSKLYNASLSTGHFPRRHRAGTTVVLQKPGKAPDELRTAGGWRPITLLNTTGKLFEKILATRIATAAETHRLLPEGANRLRIDGGATKERVVRRGVPQGSPLSPILFILFISSLYEALGAAPGLRTVGFVDDTNLLCVGRNHDETKDRLRDAWALLHFRRGRTADPGLLTLGGEEVESATNTRLLGVVLSAGLGWGKQTEAVAGKVKSALRALQATVGKSWGPRVKEARDIYLRGIRPIMTFGAAAWHRPGSGPAEGPARRLRELQAKCLRVVGGAFRATPTHHIETELGVLPLDIYLTTRKSRTLSRWEANGAAARLRHATAWVTTLTPCTRNRNPRRITPPLQSLYEGLPRTAEGAPEGDRRALARWADRRWQEKWEQEETENQRRARHLTLFPVHKPPWVRHGARAAPVLRSPRHISSILVQLRTGKIGLNAFLHERRVPGFDSGTCRCGGGPEDIYHMLLQCGLTERSCVPGVPPLRERKDVLRALDHPVEGRKIAEWVYEEGRLTYMRVGLRLAPGRDRAGAEVSREQNAVIDENF